MQYTTVALSLLAASGALAAPATRRQAAAAADTEVRVVLSDLGETGAQLTFPDGVASTATPPVSGPFATIELRLGANVGNPAQRCQALDATGAPIVVLRGANIDTTFGDGDKGAWTFQTPSLVSAVTCDPAFVANNLADATDSALRVILSNQATETGSQTSLTAGQRDARAPVATSGPFQTVELRVGDLVADQAVRCQVLDAAGAPITVTRGANVDVTFADGGKGPWSFDAATEVSQIICDPAFVQGA